MGGLSIGNVSARAGVRASAIRYYERLGLLPEPERAGGRRRYDESILEWLSLIALARESGFTIGEIKQLVRALELSSQIRTQSERPAGAARSLERAREPCEQPSLVLRQAHGRGLCSLQRRATHQLRDERGRIQLL